MPILTQDGLRPAASDFDVRLLWAAAARLKVGADGRLYTNRARVAQDRQNLHGFVEVGIGRSYIAHLGVLDIEYAEDEDGRNDYPATTVELSFGHRW